MNCEEVNSLTDSYRDSELQGPLARELEQHLADCPACERRWRDDSAWMAVLSEKTPLSGGPSAEQFTASVLKKWHRQKQPSVLARIGRLTAAAAVIALMLSLAGVFVMQGTGPSGGNLGAGSALSPATESPISVLMADAWRGARAPRAAIHQTAAYIDFAHFTRLIADDENTNHEQD